MSAEQGVVRGPVPVRQIVEDACRAPSVHNTQPWRWRWDGDRLELGADRSRQLMVTDPEGRNLTISCGAALHHLQVAAQALGWEARVERCPDPARPDLLAVVSLSPGRVEVAALERLDDLRARRTDRRRFTSWPLPDERLTAIANEAASWGALVMPIFEQRARDEVERVMALAERLQREDPRYAAELAAWRGRPDAQGVPPTSIPERDPEQPDRLARFRDGELPDPPVDLSGAADRLVALCTVEDAPADWLRCGEALSSLWLGMVRHGLSLLPMTQAVEMAETRGTLRRALLGGMVAPQLVVRVGWQEQTRSPLPHTLRRPVDEVLELREP